MLESSIVPTDSWAELIQKSSLIIWDEAPIANCAVLACVDETCRQVMQSTLPFGGKVIVLLGNFHQMCPVIRKGTKAEVIKASISCSPIWTKFTIHHLTIPIQNANHPPFAAFVDAIGDGGGPHISFQGLQHATSRTELTQFTFPPNIVNNPILCVRWCILAPTNSQVDAYNSAILNQLPGTPRIFCAADSLEEHTTISDDSEDGILPTPDAIIDYISKVQPNGMPDHTLLIKLGGVYRLLRNFLIDHGLVKNT